MKFFPNFDIKKFKHNTVFDNIFHISFPDMMEIAETPPIPFQRDVRLSGYDQYEKKYIRDTTKDSDEDDNLEPGETLVYSFTNNNKGLIVSLSQEHISLKSFKADSNIDIFGDHIRKILDIFANNYEFSRFNNMGMIQRNIINETFIPGLYKDEDTINVSNLFPELDNDALNEISKIQKTSFFESEKTLIRLIHLIATISGEFGTRILYDEKSFIVDIKIIKEVDIKDIPNAINEYASISDLCKNIFCYSIHESILKKITS